MRKIPSEAVQISAQIFALELAALVSRERRIPLSTALNISIKGTRECMERTGVIDRDEIEALPAPTTKGCE